MSNTHEALAPRLSAATLRDIEGLDAVKMGFCRACESDDKLAGSFKNISLHLFLATSLPATEWTAKGDNIPGYMDLLRAGRQAPGSMVTAYHDPEIAADARRVLAIRWNGDHAKITQYDNVRCDVLPWDDSQATVVEHPSTRTIVFVCAHRVRDGRCGYCGPIIIDLLRQTLATKDLGHDVLVFACSHVSGHAYAGNVLCYNSSGGVVFGHFCPTDIERLATHVVEAAGAKELVPQGLEKKIRGRLCDLLMANVAPAGGTALAVPMEFPVRRVVRVDWQDPLPPATPFLPVPLVNGAFALLDKRGLHVGGFSPYTGASTNAVAEYDTVSRVWTNSAIPQFPGGRVSEASLVAVNGKYYLYGGWDDHRVLGEVWCLPVAPTGEAKGCQWQCLAKGPVPFVKRALMQTSPPLCPEPRRNHSATAGVLRGRHVFFVFGGYNGSRRLNDLWAFDVDSCTWEQLCCVGPQTPSPRDGAAMAFDHSQQRLLLFAGYSHVALNDLYMLRFGDNNAGAIAPPSAATPPSATGTRAGTGSNRHNAQAAAEPEVPSTVIPEPPPPSYPTEYSWTSIMAEAPPTRRHGCFAIVSGHFFVVGFGEDCRGPTRECFQLHLLDNSWTICNFDGDEVEGRASAAIACSSDGKRAVVCGGRTVDGRYLTSLLDIELERTEPPTKGKK